MQNILVIDDLRIPNHPIFQDAVVDIARNSKQGFSYLTQATHYDVVFWDHDLGGDDTTRPIALWLAEEGFNGNPKSINQCIVHTSNSAGSAWLMGTLGSRFLPYEVIRVNALDFFTA